MHTHKRLLLIAALVTGLLPMGATLGAALLAADREATETRMSVALEDARDGYRESASLVQREQDQRDALASADRRVRALEVEKTELRSKISALLSEQRNTANRADQLIVVEERGAAAEREERARLALFVRQAYARGLVDEDARGTSRTLARRLTGESLGDSVEAQLRAEAISRAQRQIIVAVQQSREASALGRRALQDAAGALSAQVTALQARREQVLTAYAQAVDDRDRAERGLALSRERLEDIQRETALVQAEVLRMQGELSRINTRVRIRAERELIQMGLREARPDRYAEPAELGPASFAWPVTGIVTAGFLNDAYRRSFGVPHKGLDIAVPQGTDVVSAADGVVFLARDGGLRGFSYILVGHRDGYATLYGHLSSFSVATGDDVRRGEVIGKSGGRPGTHGAGPMTTGPHLHFEVLQNGVHKNPQSLLP